MQGDDPPYLPVGTAVSAKYKGAFCEAKVSKVVRVVKCKITFKMGLGTATVTDEHIRGPLRVGHTVQARHSEKKEFVEATITKIQDCSQYTVVFDDGDITTLRRTALCLKSGRHFNESETLDQLPLTHPEHFGNPVVGGRRGRRSRQLKEDSSEGEAEDETEPENLQIYSGDIGKVVCVEASDKKKSKDNWFPGLVVVPSAQPTVRINVKEEYLVRSFKDGRYYTVPKKEILEFSRDMSNSIENQSLAEAMEKALKYLDNDELPAHWERGPLFDLQVPESDSDENYTDSSDDEPREEKDHFVAQLYKFMDDRGTPLNKNPMISNRDIDLYKLFRLVHKLGGYNRVTNQNKWRSVSIRLGYPHNHATYNSVKQAYKKFLLNFEDFYRKLGCTMINHPRNAKKNRGRSLIRDRDRATPINSSPRPDRSEENIDIPIDKKEEPEKSPEVKPKTKPEVKPKEKDVEPEKPVPKKKELLIESADSSNSSSSDVIIDVQSDSGQSTTKETTKIKKTETKPVKERKVKGASGEKVKALIEKFEDMKKEEKDNKQEEIKPEEKSQTRSKSLGPRSKDITSPEAKETTKEITKTPKSKTKPEEDKKRGRKRKDTEKDTEKASETANESPTDTPVNVGDKLKVYYGPTHESKVTYEAKVLEIDTDDTGFSYLVHYTGWNTRYDEWIKPARIAENSSHTTKAKRLKQSQGSTSKANSSTSKPAPKRGRGMSVSSRSQDPPRSTTPSSVTSSSSRTKSPATPAGKSSRVTRQGSEVTRRTRRTSAVSIPSESESEQSESELELSRTRSGSKNEESAEKEKSITKKKMPQKRKEKDDDDTEKEEEPEKPKRGKRLTKKAPETKVSSADSDDDSSSPPKGRDFDLNEIRSELKGFEKVKMTVKMTGAAENIFEEKVVSPETKVSTVTEKKLEDKSKIEKQVESSTSTDDIYEFKEPEPFEFERGPKLNEEKGAKKRLVPRLFDDITEKPDKSPKKKGGKSPPKNETKEVEEGKKRIFKRTPTKKLEEEREKTPPKEETSKVCDDPFDKLVESPSFNISSNITDKKDTASPDITKSKVVKALNLDESLSLFHELPETVGEDSGDRLELSDTDDAHNEPLFTHQQLFIDAAFAKSESSSLDPIFRGFNTVTSCDDNKKRLNKDGASDEDDPIDAAIHRVMTQPMIDEDSSNDDLFITQPTTIYQPKIKPKEETPTPMVTIPQTVKKEVQDDRELLSVTTDVIKDTKPKEATTTKLISPALQETDSSLLEAISAQTAELLKKEETKEPQIKTGTKIADSILQKFNMIKKKEENKPIKTEVKAEIKVEKPVEVKKEVKVEVKTEVPEIKESVPESVIKVDNVTNVLEVKKRPAKKFVSREFIEESDSDSSDSEQRLVIARSDEDSQTNPSDKLDFKDTDSNTSVLQVNTDDSEEPENTQVFKFEETKQEPVPETPTETVKMETNDVKQEEDQDNNISLLLCKETIPGSPAPVPEVPTTPETRVKPKSARGLILEMPFASAPGNSNSKGLLTNSVELKQQQKITSKVDTQPLAIPLEPSLDANEPSSVGINTPPTTPESTISNLSPRGDQDRISSNVPDNESYKSTDSGPREQSSKITHYSEEDTLMTSESCPVPKKTPKEENAAPCRKRRRSCKNTEEIIPPKRGRRPLVRNLRTNSDSDDTSEHSAPNSTPPSAHSNNLNASTSSETRMSSRSPRPSKYNFIIELDPSMDCSQRIQLLQQKITDLCKTYNNVKSDLACIDRRRKKLKRRGRETFKPGKQEMACA